jgi:hypothetical protein
MDQWQLIRMFSVFLRVPPCPWLIFKPWKQKKLPRRAQRDTEMRDTELLNSLRIWIFRAAAPLRDYLSRIRWNRKSPESNSDHSWLRSNAIYDSLLWTYANNTMNSCFQLRALVEKKNPAFRRFQEFFLQQRILYGFTLMAFSPFLPSLRSNLLRHLPWSCQWVP